MTLDELQRDWQKYALEIDVYFPKEDRKVKGRVILREKFFVCFIVKEENALLFDPGGNLPICLMLRPGKDYDCHMKFPGGAWMKIGKFVLLEG